MDTAFFYGSAGTVTLGNDITAGGLIFGTSGYTIASAGNTLTLGAPVTQISLRNGATATIAAPLAGTGSLVINGDIFGGQTAGTLTLQGSGSALTGTVEIQNGTTVNLSGASGTTFSAISSLTLNGGGLTLTNAAGEGSLNRVNDTAGITSNGGTITYTNATGTNTYAENLGTLSLNSGRLVVISTNAVTSPATETLTFAGLIRVDSSTSTLAVGGSGLGSNAQNRILVTGMAATPAGQIVGPWATYGSSATSQTDYAIYDATNGFKAAAIAASAESTWSDSAKAYTMSGNANLSGTRTVAALRMTGSAAQLALGAGANLETYGVLNGGSGALTIAAGSGGVLTTPTGGGKLFLTTGTSQPITVTAPIVDNNGSVTVVASGANTLTLSGTNSYTGGTVINSGTVAVSSDAALGAMSGGLTFDGTGMLSLTASTTLNAARTMTLNNTALATLSTGNLSHTIAGKITGSGGIIVTGGNTTTLSSLDNDFAGTLRIANSGTSTTVNVASLADSATANGAIRLGNGGATGTFGWDVNAATSLVLNNRQIDLTGTTAGGTINNNSATQTVAINTDLLITGTGNKTLTLGGIGVGAFNGDIADSTGTVISLSKSGTGTWTLGGANTYTGTTTISGGGTVIINTAQALGSGTSFAFTSGTLQGNGTGTLTFGQNVTQTGSFALTGSNAFAFNGSWLNSGASRTLTIDAAGGATLAGNIFLSESASTARSLLIAGSGDVLISGVVANYNGTGTASNLSYSGSGTLTLTGANTYTGSTTVNNADGVIRVDGAGKLGAGGVYVTSGQMEILATAQDQSIGLLQLGSTGAMGSLATLSIGDGRTLNLGGTLTASSGLGGTGYITGGTLNLGGVDRAFIVGDQIANPIDLQIDSVITSSGGALVKNGSGGTLKLTATNTYTGNTQIDAGLIEVSGLHNLGNGSLISFGGGGLRWAPGSTFDVSTRNTLFTGSATFNTNGNDVVIANSIGGGGAGSFTKTGDGVLTLSTANALNYSGATTVNQGTLVLGGSETISALNMGGVAGASSTLDLGGNQLTLNGTVLFTSSNGGLTGTITGTAGSILDFNGGTRTFTIGDSVNASPDFVIASGVTLQNGSMIKNSSGALRIDGTNKLTSIEVQAGQLLGNLGSANLILNGAVYEGSGAFTRNLGAGDSQVRWASGGNGGFAARGGAFEVTLNGVASPALVWSSTPDFISGSGQLLLGSVTADDVVTLTNDINLNSGASSVVRTVQAVDNTTATTDKAVLSGVLSSSGSGAVTLTKSGNGTLELTGANTFAGTVSVSGGTLQFSNSGNLGKTGNTVTLAGGNLEYLGSTATALTGPLSISSTSKLTNSGTGALSFGGNTTLAASLTIDGVSPIAFGGVLTNSGDRTVTVNNTGGITIGGINLTDSSSARTLILNAAAGATISVTGTIANGGSGSSAFRKDGAGSLILNGESTFTNELRIYQGTVEMNASRTALQTSGNSIVFSNGNVLGATSKLILNGAGVTYNLGGSVVYVGNSTNAQSTATISGTGKLNLNATRTFDVRPSTDATGMLVVETEIADGSAPAGITKSRNGLLVFSGDNTYTGTTTVNEGTLRLDYSSRTGSKISTTGTLVVGGATLELIGNSSKAVTQSVGSTTVNQGSSTVAVRANGGPGITLDLGAITMSGSGKTVDFVSEGAGAVIKTSNSLVNGIFGGWATYNGRSFASSEDGVIVGVAPSIRNDVGTWASDQNISNSAAFSGSTVGVPRISSLAFGAAAASTLNISRYLDINSGGILVSADVGANASVISGGNLVSTGGALYVHQYNTAETLTISSAVRGTVSLSKAGEGELILDSATNDSSGSVYVNRGTLTLRGGNAIGDTATVVVDGVTGVTLRLEADEWIGALTGGSTDGGTMDIGDHTLTLNNGATFSGRLAGSGTIIKYGTSNLTFNSVSSAGFTGSLIVNQGLAILGSNGISNLVNAAAVTVNPSGALLIDNNSATVVADRISNTADVTFNSANGLNGTSGPMRGLWLRTDQNATRTEAVGATAFNSGASYAVIEASASAGNTLSISDFQAASFTRSNRATLTIRGTNLGSSSTIPRGLMRLSTTAAETAFTSANLIGGTSGTALGIVPWMVGQDLGTAILDTTANNQRGNTLVTYVGGTSAIGTGFRPLNLATEYATYASAGATNNVRASLSADLAGLSGKTVNSLVVNNSGSSAVTVSGSGNLVVNSGAFLFTAVNDASPGAELAAPQGIMLNGFGSITVGPSVGSVGNEFVFHVVNGAGAGVTIASPLVDSTAGNTALTKSGLGTLILAAANGYTGATTLNEGTLVINSWDGIGGANGGAELVFAGGTLKLGTGFTGDFNRTSTIKLGQGGGVIDTNGSSLAFNVGLSDLGTMSGGLTKAGLGTLTLNGAATNTGSTVVSGGILQLGGNQAIGTGSLVVNNAVLDVQDFIAVVDKVTLANAAGSAITGTGTLTSNGTIFDVQQGSISVNLAGSSSLIKSGSSTVTLSGSSTYTGATEVRNGTLSFNSIANLGIASALGAPLTADTGAIRIGLTSSSGTLIYTGTGSVSNRRVDLVGTTGGGTITNNGTGALVLGGVANAGAGNKVLTLNGTNTDRNTIAGAIEDNGNGALAVTKSQAGTWVMTGANTYTGATTISGGTLGLDGSGMILGPLTITSGTLDLASSGVNQAFGLVTLGGGSAGSSATILIGAGRKISLGGAGITFSAANNNLGAVIAGGSGAVIDLQGESKTFTVGDSTAASFDVSMDDNVAVQNGTLVKAGAGTLRIGGANGLSQIEIQAGVVNANAGTANILLNGGVLETRGVLNRALGAGLNEMQWGSGSGGFAAQGGDLTVSIAGVSGPLVWGGLPNFVADSAPLIFGSTSADSTVIFAHELDLNNTGGTASRTIQVNDNAASSSDSLLITGVLSNSAGTADLVKTGAGVLRLAQAPTYTGTTFLDGGMLVLESGFLGSAPVVFGSSTSVNTAGGIQVSGDTGFSGLTVQTNTTAANRLVIDSGKMLVITGNVVIGNSASGSLTNTVLTTAGGGELIVENLVSGSSFTVGGYTGTVQGGNKAVADFSGLSSLTITLSTANGVIRVNGTSSYNMGNATGTLILAESSVLKAATLSIGDGGQFSSGADQTNTLKLGTGLTRIQANTINVGTGFRDMGAIVFNNSDSGTLIVRNASGVDRANMNIGTTGGVGTGTTNASGNTVDLRGHQSDLLLNTLAIGTQNRNAFLNNTFSFDRGTLDMNALVVSTRNPSTAAANQVTNSTVDFGSADSTALDTVTIQNGISQFAQVGAAAANASVSATLNIGGGVVTVGATGGTSINMASATATNTASATLNFTGGTASFAGNIVKGGGAGNTTATINVDGGTLAANGNTISADVYNFRQGTLRDIGNLYTGDNSTPATLVKTTAGLLKLEGTNTYTGPTHIDAGTFMVNGSLVGTTPGTVSVNDTGTLAGRGTIAGPVTVNSGGTLSPGDGLGTLSTGSLTFNGNAVFSLEINSDTVTGDSVQVAGALTLSSNNDVKLQITDLGTGTLTPFGTAFVIAKYTAGSTVSGLFSLNGIVLQDYNPSATEPNSSVFMIGNNAYAVDYNYDVGGNTQNVALVVVPEPNAVVSLVGSLGLLLGLQRRRRVSRVR